MSRYVLTCASVPASGVGFTGCPTTDQQWTSLADLNDPADWGITAESVTIVYGFGAGAVLMMFLIGYALAISTGMVQKV